MLTLLENVHSAIQECERNGIATQKLGAIKLQYLLATILDVAPELLLKEDTTAGTIIQPDETDCKVPHLIMVTKANKDDIVEEVSLRETGVDDTWRVAHRRQPYLAVPECRECNAKHRILHTTLGEAVSDFERIRQEIIDE